MFEDTYQTYSIFFKKLGFNVFYSDIRIHIYVIVCQYCCFNAEWIMLSWMMQTKQSVANQSNKQWTLGNRPVWMRNYYFPPTMSVRVSVTVRVSLVWLLRLLPLTSQTKLTLTVTLTLTDTGTLTSRWEIIITYPNWRITENLVRISASSVFQLYIYS